MKSISSMKRTVARLETILLPTQKPDKGPPFDYGLFTVKECDISDTIHLFHDIAVRLGHGTFNACKYSFPGGWSSHNEEDRKEAIDNATPEELIRINLECEIGLKWIRLTPLLTEDEKAIIKQYNRMANAYKFSKPPYSGTTYKTPDPEKFREAKLLYEQIMAKYGAKSYEDNLLGSYVACSGIPLDMLREMDPTVAAYKEKIGAFLI